MGRVGWSEVGCVGGRGEVGWSGLVVLILFLTVPPRDALTKMFVHVYTESSNFVAADGEAAHHVGHLDVFALRLFFSVVSCSKTLQTPS